MDRTKGLAYCGLACCVCSENTECAGCRNDGCKDKDWCQCFRCGKEKGYAGCWECPDFPCNNKMLNKLRIRTFAKFIAEHGEEKLMDALEYNEAHGVIYHYPGKLTGDYDQLKSETEIFDLLLKGPKK